VNVICCPATGLPPLVSVALTVPKPTPRRGARRSSCGAAVRLVAAAGIVQLILTNGTPVESVVIVVFVPLEKLDPPPPPPPGLPKMPPQPPPPPT
jgi:hypothetical protein